jgi:hypothetical protein
MTQIKASLWPELKRCYGWHKEVRKAFTNSNRAAKLYHWLPLMIASFAVTVGSVWLSNWTSSTVVDVFATLYDGIAINLGPFTYSSNAVSHASAVIGVVALFGAILFKGSRRMRNTHGIKRFTVGSVIALATVWSLLWALCTYTALSNGYKFMLGSILWLLVALIVILMVSGFIYVFIGWFWTNKVISLYWPWVGWLITAATSALGIKVAVFLAANTKLLYPNNLHHAFDLVAPTAVMVVAWYMRITTCITAMIPWIVEFRIIQGFRREGDNFRNSSYFQRWCSPREREMSSLYTALKDECRNRLHGTASTPHQDAGLRASFRELFREVFR